MNDNDWKRFNRHIIKQMDGCWIWTATKFSDKYGSFWLHGRMRLAHRCAYEHIHGVLPQHLSCCHTCSNKLCVNPEHLIAGTQQENSMDARDKGLLKNCKLDWDKVNEIKDLLAKGYTQKQIAHSFNVDVMTISNIKNGKSWVRK